MTQGVLSAPAPTTFTLRPYQTESINAVYDHLRLRDDNPCVVIPTAGGKTPVMATICRDAVQQWNGRVLILAHVKELLEQAVDKLHTMAPDLWNQIGVYSAGLKSRDTDHAIIVAGIQSVYRRAAELDRFDLIMIDECFVAGTRVSTPSGELPIELVQPGMFVQTATGIGRVLATSARSASDLVTLEYSDGTVITCTASHPIFTESGWRAAGSLEVGSLAFGVESMRMLRAGVPSVDQTATGREPDNPEGASLAEAAVLLDLLCQDPQQLHEIAEGTGEGQYHYEGQGSCAKSARRQRAVDRTTREVAETDRRRLGGGIRSSGPGLPLALPAEASQDRRCTTGLDDRHRTGRSEPPFAGSSSSRFSQDHLPGTKRLVRVSRHERARDRVVFNLHVSGHPSYFANGILAHNCHLIPPDGEGMYRTFLADAKVVNPNVRLVGLTATPYRMTTGTICGADKLLNHVCYEVGVRELIVQGYLCPLKSKAGKRKADTSGLHLRGGEFIAGEVEQLMDDDSLVRSACREIIAHAQDRRSVLIFAAGVQHALHVQRVLDSLGHECGFVHAETLPFDRTETLKRFRKGELKYLVNVNVLTTGFDAPNIDCIALLRPTNSPGLYYQMVGRGFRLHPGKDDCLVLDFGGNILRHGPVDDLQIKEPGQGDGDAPAKECPQCQAVIHAAYATCPECGHEFPPPDRQRHDQEASTAGILSGETTDTEHEVTDTFYSVHVKRDAPEDHPRTMRVEYRIGFNQYVSEWVCVEHSGYARAKAESWWRARSREPVPGTAEEAVELAEMGALAKTLAVTVRQVAGEKYDRIIRHALGPIPPRPEDPDQFDDDAPLPCGVDAEDVPF